MREICMSGSEGEGTEINRFSLPLFELRPFGPEIPGLNVCGLFNSSPKLYLVVLSGLQIVDAYRLP
jgi:hypothetical protein